MKTVRVVYEKTGGAKYISHLDVNRYMLRALQRSRLPVWWTQGFHPHIYCTFALPLSLGYTSSYEVVEFRVTQDELSCREILTRLQQVTGDAIHPIAAAEAVMKIAELCFATYEIRLPDLASEIKAIEEFWQADSIVLDRVSRKTGKVTSFDLKEKCRAVAVESKGDDAVMTLTLPAGTKETVNPSLITEALKRSMGAEALHPQIHRTGLYNGDMRPFL